MYSQSLNNYCCYHIIYGEDSSFNSEPCTVNQSAITLLNNYCAITLFMEKIVLLIANHVQSIIK